jgi:hypothetical protein
MARMNVRSAAWNRFMPATLGAAGLGSAYAAAKR